LNSQGIGVKFAKDGPSIPIELLQSLEDGNLVVFCGAGISRYLGLPDFKGLVSRICAELNRPLQPDEETIQQAGAYDLALGLIENRIGKTLLRRAVAQVLDIKKDSDLSTHKALLQLATTKNGQTRLVTTNFDRAFELARDGHCSFDYAPYIPHPDKTWNSIVHLHGGLGNPRDRDGSSLVFTSADFGRAYLTEAWAGRFLAELFRRSSAILFVGYSVSDPAVRYTVDAFAADRSGQADRIAKAYLLAPGSETAQTWSSRGIEPIIYDDRDDHGLLHQTLRNCAKRYRSGFFDRDSIVLEYGSQNPLSGLEPEAISQITWALNDGSGHAARRFGELDPTPPIDWLDILEEAGLFQIAPHSTQSGGKAPPVTFVPTSQFVVPLEATAWALCQWMSAHLGEARLISWVVKNGAHLHPVLAEIIRRSLETEKATNLSRGAKLFWAFLSAEQPRIFSRGFSHEALQFQAKIGNRLWSPLVRDLVLSWLPHRALVQKRELAIAIEALMREEAVVNYCFPCGGLKLLQRSIEVAALVVEAPVQRGYRLLATGTGSPTLAHTSRL
jgi:hypothetical protein